MNTKILVSLLVIGLSAIAIGGAMTGAFFTDTETSEDNTFKAGDIDLQIDSKCTYNNLRCIDQKWEGTTMSCDCNWPLTDLTTERFFDFTDIKPGDFGENTLSIHVSSNDAWMCATIAGVQNENSCTEPELIAEPSCVAEAPTGQLAQEMNFLVWADSDCDNIADTVAHCIPKVLPGDGDDVAECAAIDEEVACNAFIDDEQETTECKWVTAEPVLTEGNGEPFLNGGITYPIADITTGGGPIKGSTDPDAETCVGIYWCAGTIGGVVDKVVEGPITCDGESMGNEAQTDSLVADITFNAVQSRNNLDFLCSCGDDVCEGQETTENCPEDCKPPTSP